MSARATKLEVDLGAIIDTRDHYAAQPTSWIGACSDIGRRHHVNQDALTILASESAARAVIAVSDGVTSADASEVGAMLAAQVAATYVQEQLAESTDLTDALAEAFREANYAVLSGAPTAACTLIVAVIADGLITVANLGDSRAYWVGEDGETLTLSVDDSIAQLRMNLGVSREEAENSVMAHAIVRWIGRDTTDVTPSIRGYRPNAPGWLVVCSDGLWNFASAEDDFGSLVRRLAKASPNPKALAESLVDWANEEGGHDNITVALARFEGWRA